jgi:predicted membrane channel-forming protein YqfA (hemolysin III family)
MEDELRASRPRGAGGTPGGLTEFFFGAALVVAGGYLLTNQVMVSTGYWQLWGHSAFGLSLVPLLIGIGLHIALNWNWIRASFLARRRA